MKTVFFALLILFASSTARADEWTTADTYREITYFVVQTADWAQTRNMARSNWTTRIYGDTWYQDHYKYEVNPLMGKHPNVKKVDLYFVLSELAHIGISYSLPNEWRHGYQYVTIGIELGFVQHNRSIGISARF